MRSGEETMELGRAAQRLLDNEDFQTVIIEGYIYGIAGETGTSFTGEPGQADMLKAVSHLNLWFNQLIEDAKILKQEK